MSPLLHWLTSPEWALVVKALLHSLWQGAVVALGLAIVFRWVVNPSTRYRLALVALGVMFTVSLITWGLLNAPQSISPGVQPGVESVAAAPIAAGPVQKFVVIANRTQSQPATQWTAWLALAWLLGASAMLGRASVKVAGAEQLRRSCQPLNDSHIAELVAEARRAVKLTRQVRLAVTNQLTSPAVVGVLVPTLILPLSLITTLTPEQLRFILLHELAHIRRGDYLANLFQLFAEALFFFNPAVWWLSHQIRREREACCDALAIELSGAPADYARTLVSVAETMLQPAPAVAPAFGNNREPSSLTDRVHRVLVPGHRPSLRLTWRAMLAALGAGVVLLGLLAAGTRETVAATAALLEPKGISTQANLDPAAPDPGYGMWQHELASVGTTNRKESVAVLLREVEQSSFASAFDAWRQESKALSEQRSSSNSYSIPSGVLGGGKFTPSRIAALQCRLGQEAHLHEPFLLKELVADAKVHVILESSPRLCEKYGIFSMAPVQFIPGQGYQSRMNSGSSPQIQQALWLKAMTNASPQANGPANGRQPIPSERNQIPSTNSLAESFLLLPNQEVASSKNQPALYSRTFKVDTNEFAQALGMCGPVTATNAQVTMRNFFSSLGMDLSASGKSLYYNARRGTLIVRASLTDLDIIEQALQVMNVRPPQVHIAAKFIEVPDQLMTNSLFEFILKTNKAGSVSGVLSEPQARVFFKALEQWEGVEILSAPEVTTLSGRQAQIQVVDMKTLVTGVTATITNGAEVVRLPQTTNMPFGPVLDVVPYVAADGRSIQMVVIPTVTEFLGYDDPGSVVSAKAPIPHYRVRQIPTSTPNNIPDGQTLVMGGFTSEDVWQLSQGVVSRQRTSGPNKKHLLVFVTPTIIDAAGNRVHTDEEMPYHTNAVPKQPGK